MVCDSLWRRCALLLALAAATVSIAGASSTPRGLRHLQTLNLYTLKTFSVYVTSPSIQNWQNAGSSLPLETIASTFETVTENYLKEFFDASVMQEESLLEAVQSVELEVKVSTAFQRQRHLQEGGILAEINGAATFRNNEEEPSRDEAEEYLATLIQKAFAGSYLGLYEKRLESSNLSYFQNINDFKVTTDMEEKPAPSPTPVADTGGDVDGEWSPLDFAPITNAVERFPLKFALVMLYGACLFSVWAIFIHRVGKAEEELEERPILQRSSSWTTRERSSSSATEADRSLPANQVDQVPSVLDCDINSAASVEVSYHLDDEETVAAGPKPKAALLSWSNVTCSYPISKSSDEHFTSLYNSFGEMRASELTAIMGGSGSGKSTLLDILSGRKSLGKIDGKLHVLGKKIDDIRAQEMDKGGELRSVAAYVPQQEAFFPTQTAEEAVAFAANLKLGRERRGDDVRWSRIQSVLREVGLSPETCKRPIGGVLAGGLVIRGLSGGERKRLAVACALALKPRLLFLDEITSGLDSETALAITKLLKRLCASGNVAAMMVIHQPNGALFREFDRLVLLTKGKTIFSNDASRLPELYSDVFMVPMPEWYDVPSDLMTQAAEVSDLPAIAFSPYDSRQLVPTSPHGNAARIEPPSEFWKFKAVFQRNLTNHYVRNITNLACRLGLYGATSLIDGLLFWQVADLKGGDHVGVEISTVVGALTFIILVSYLLPFAMLPLFVHDKKFFLAESALGLYSPWLYCLSQIILETWVIVLAATIEACIVIPMCGLWNPAMARWESFFTFLGSLIVSGLTGSALVLFHAIVLPSQDLAFLAGSGAVTISLALSGGFVPFPSIEEFISWLQWVSPCKYTLQALALTFFKGTTYENLVNEIYAFDKPATVSSNIGVLIAFFAALAGGTMFALSRQREVR